MVHITLVGAQPAPVYNGIVATKPDIVEFVYSADTEDVVRRIKAEVSCRIVDSNSLILSPVGV